MKRMQCFVLFAALAALAAVAAGCGGSYQARNVDLKPVLVGPEVLVKGTGDQALYRYVNDKVDLKQYNAAIVDPVLVMKNGKLSDDERKEYQKLADNAYTFMVQELSKGLAVVKEPQPGAVRVQMAILDADPSHPLRNVLTSLSPVGIGLNILTYAATGSQAGVGDITVEMKFTDANSGELLAAALDKRVGGKNPEGTFDTWANANAALQYWAKRTAFVACEMRGKGNCTKP